MCSSGLTTDDFYQRPPAEKQPNGVHVHEVFFRLINDNNCFSPTRLFVSLLLLFMHPVIISSR